MHIQKIELRAGDRTVRHRIHYLGRIRGPKSSRANKSGSWADRFLDRRYTSAPPVLFPKPPLARQARDVSRTSPSLPLGGPLAATITFERFCSKDFQIETFGLCFGRADAKDRYLNLRTFPQSLILAAQTAPPSGQGIAYDVKIVRPTVAPRVSIGWVSDTYSCITCVHYLE